MKTIIFFTIDGVLNISRESTTAADSGLQFIAGQPCWPIPMARELIQYCTTCPYVRPVWLTAWAQRAQVWNDWAETEHWPVVYHLRRRQIRYGQTLFSEVPTCNVGTKLFAVRYYLRHRPLSPLLWIEDTFTNDTYSWILKRNTQAPARLVDTTLPGIRTFLVQNHADKKAAAESFIFNQLLINHGAKNS
jgi:hypothetical protein